MSRKLLAGLLRLACYYCTDDPLPSLPELLLLSNGSMLGYLKWLLGPTLEPIIHRSSINVFLIYSWGHDPPQARRSQQTAAFSILTAPTLTSQCPQPDTF